MLLSITAVERDFINKYDFDKKLRKVYLCQGINI